MLRLTCAAMGHEWGGWENLVCDVCEKSRVLSPFTVYVMLDDRGEAYLYAEADDMPYCTVVGFTIEEIYENMSEAQDVWMSIQEDSLGV